jgi:hypothetical protein
MRNIYWNLKLANQCTRTELWSTVYDLTKSYKLKQRLSRGSHQARQNSGPAKQNQYEHKHMFNRCSTGANLKHSNSFPIDAPQAHNFVHLCEVYPFYHSLGSPYKSLPLKISFLEIFNPIFLLILIGSRRDPGLASEEVLASIWFYANKHFYEYWYSLISSFRI